MFVLDVVDMYGWCVLIYCGVLLVSFVGWCCLGGFGAVGVV